MNSTKKHLFSLTTLLIIVSSACSNKQQADKILINGLIYTVDQSFSVAEAMAIRDGEILAVGSDQEILNYYTSDSITDLHNLAVFPGFIDAHTHFMRYAYGLQQIDLVGTQSFDEVIQKIQRHVEQFPDDKWVLGHGWDQNDWGNDTSFPRKDTLDLLFPDKIIALTRIDHHAVLTNQQGLAIANITGKTNIEGGEVITDGGQPTGVLIDAAGKLVLNRIPEIAQEQKVKLLKQAEANCFNVGLSSLVEAGLEKSQIDLLDKLQKENELAIRIYAMLNPSQENIEHYFSNGHYKTDRLHVRSFKIYGDGALGSRGACLINPYTDKSDSYGFLLSTPAVFDSLAKDFALKNFQMNTHAIGDSANRLITNIYGKYLKGKNNKRWRIEHAQVVHPTDLKKFGQYNILPSVQPTHATSDMSWVEKRLGQERLQNAYAYNSLMKTSGKLLLGSDFPVENINPLYGFHAAVSRQDAENKPGSGFLISEKISREEALKGMTIWAAFGQFEEEEKGSLEAGKLADFVILDQDIMKVDYSKIRATRVMQTWVGGKKVYQIQ
ncbi:MAG: putative amidohydrolase YtcJ [Marivirga sp.]|jgi:predicted amidohydrolase YtcJ